MSVSRTRRASDSSSLRVTGGALAISLSKSARSSSSTSRSLVAVTVADRGSPSMRESSPTTSPGPRRTRRFPPRTISALPVTMMNASPPAAPWRVSTVPFLSSAGTVSAATCPSCLLVQVANSGIFPRSSILRARLTDPIIAPEISELRDSCAPSERRGEATVCREGYG